MEIEVLNKTKRVVKVSIKLSDYVKV